MDILWYPYRALQGNHTMNHQLRVSGTLHFYTAFDWGEEVDLAHALKLIAAEPYALPRRRRTPSSFAYRPQPLRSLLGQAQIDLPDLGKCEASVEATVFDFAAVSVQVRIPFEMPADALSRVAGELADPKSLMQLARERLEALHQRLLPAIRSPHWGEHSEEYVVFELPPGQALPGPVELIERCAGWLAGLLRLESGPLSGEEIQEAIRLRLSYSPTDLFLADWPAAVLIDKECDDTLEVIEFANLQLLEFRDIDTRLDDRLSNAYKLIHAVAGSWLPFWRSHTRSLRAMGEMKVEANSVFERTGNALKLVGDQYLARVYRMLSSRFHLEEWQRSIERSLTVVAGVYEVLSDQAATWRTELLEIIVIALILMEIVMAYLRH